jgi:hypothetical protein
MSCSKMISEILYSSILGEPRLKELIKFWKPSKPWHAWQLLVAQKTIFK